MSNNTQSEQAVSLLGFGDEAIAAILVFILGAIFTIIWSSFRRDKYRLAYGVSHKELTIDAPNNIKEKINITTCIYKLKG